MGRLKRIGGLANRLAAGSPKTSRTCRRGGSLRGVLSVESAQFAEELRRRQLMAYSVGWGLERGPLAAKCETAREALLLAEQHLTAERTAVVVTDLVAGEPMPIETLRQLAEEEAGLETRNAPLPASAKPREDGSAKAWPEVNAQLDRGPLL
jgi:hypothetical protein